VPNKRTLVGMEDSEAHNQIIVRSFYVTPPSGAVVPFGESSLVVPISVSRTPLT